MKKITEISAQKRNPKRCNLYLDGEFFCGVQLITVMQNRLKVGDIIAEERLNEMIMQSEKETAMELSLNYVSKSMHTKMQIIKYLKGKEFLPEIITEVINKLTEYGYVNDGVYSKSYVEQRKNVKGKRLIAYELKLKGVDEKIIDETMQNAPSEDDGAYYTAKKFFKNKEISFENISKCYRRLLSKGFNYDTAKSVVDRIKNENEYSDD